MKPVLFYCLLALEFSFPALESLSAAESGAARFASPARRARYLQHLDLLLKAGENRDRGVLESAGRHVRAARRLNPDDARLDYAHGLVLLEHFKFPEAVERFRAASRSEAGLYLPALKARFRTLLQLGDADTVLADVEDLARTAGDPATAWADGSSPAEAARRLGRVMGFLALPGVDLVEPQTLIERDERVRGLLGPARESAYLSGLGSIQREYEYLELQVREELASMAARRQDRAERELADIADRKKDLQERAENVKLSAEEWEAWLQERLQDSDKQLKRLQQDFVVLDRVAGAVSARILQIQLERNRLQAELEFRSVESRTRGRRRTPVASRPLALQQELLRNQLQYSRLQAQANGIIGRAAAVKAGRAAAVKKYQQATGKLVEQDAALKRWNKMLEQSALNAAAESTEAPPKATLPKRLTLPATYFELEFELEKERILNSYSDTTVAQQSPSK